MSPSTPLDHWLSLFKAPFWYEKDTCIIYDADMNPILSMDFEGGDTPLADEEVIDASGAWIAEAMNEKAEKEKA